MTPYEEPPAPPPPAEESLLLDERPPRGRPVIAWLVILSVTALVIAAQNLRPPPKDEPVAGKVDPTEIDPRELEGRVLLGMREAFSTGREELARKADALKGESYRDELKLTALHGELSGPSDALDRLARADARFPPDRRGEADARIARLLERLYSAYKEQKAPDPAVLGAHEQGEIRDRLGWFGELALRPQGGPDAAGRKALLREAELLFIGLTVGIIGGCGVILFGCVLLIVLLVSMSHGPHRRGFRPGSPYGGIYAETFAVWMLVFTAAQVVGMILPLGDSRLLVSGVFFLLTLTVLGWPVLRGVPWSAVREDLGLHFAGKPVRQVLSGPVAYLSSIPLLLVGAAVSFGLMSLFRRVQGAVPPAGGGDPGEATPMHPIVRMLGDADPWALFQVYFAACVVAPVVEEIFFRGALYRHLREGTNAWGFSASLLFSGLMASVLFAVIHPQGLFAVPVLSSLAFGFTLAREWRGSIVPCVIAHAINNAVAVTLMHQLLSN